MSFTRVLSGTVLMASLCFGVGCATSPKPESAAPGVPGESVQATPSPQAVTLAEPEPRTLSEAEALLERARADLDRLALNEPVSAAANEATAAAPSPAAPGRSERADKTAEDAPAAKALDPCEAACRAFASLTRASEAVCRLDANGGKRCERARQIRDGASQRVARCGCAG